MPGPAVRFDYQSLDIHSGRIYISHMNANQLVVFDTATRQVLANLDEASWHRIACIQPPRIRCRPRKSLSGGWSTSTP
jgi:hypothetical protein